MSKLLLERFSKILLDEDMSGLSNKTKTQLLFSEINSSLPMGEQLEIEEGENIISDDFKNFLYLSKKFPSVDKKVFNKLFNCSKNINMFKPLYASIDSTFIEKEVTVDFLELIETSNNAELVNYFYDKFRKLDNRFESFEKRYMNSNFNIGLLTNFIASFPDLENYTGKKNKNLIKRLVYNLNNMTDDNLEEILSRFLNDNHSYSSSSKHYSDMFFSIIYSIIYNDTTGSIFKEDLEKYGLANYNFNYNHKSSVLSNLSYLMLTNSTVFLNILKEVSDSKGYLEEDYLRLPRIFYAKMDLNNVNKNQLDNIVNSNNEFKTIFDVFKSYELFPTSKEISILVKTIGTLSYDDISLFANIYCKLNTVIAKEDDKLRVIQELVNNNFINIQGGLKSLNIITGKKQKVLNEITRPIYQMMDIDNPYNITNMHTYLKYLSIKAVISEIKDLTEDDVLFIYELDIDEVSKVTSIEELRSTVLQSNSIKKLRENLKIGQEFINKYSPNILKALSGGEVNIINKYYGDNNQTIQNNFIPIVKAYLMGESSFRLMKYYDGDLERELDVEEIDENIKDGWKKNFQSNKDNFEVFETDTFEDSIRLGEIPTGTCMHWGHGSYNKCLLSIFDSNKKQLYIKKNGQIVARAIIRFTKVSKENITKDSDFSFVDLEKLEQGIEKKVKKKEEKMVIFIEKIYTCVYEDLEIYKNMMKDLMIEKTTAMGIDLLMSFSLEKSVSKSLHMYISKSKNGYQYIDSLRGQQGPDDGGKYVRSNFYSVE